MTTFKAAPISGFFLDVPNVANKPVYPDEMRYVYRMQNCSVNQACVAANADAPDNCMFAEHTFPHIKTPLFIQNSAYDSWQLLNIYFTELPGHGACVAKLSACTPSDMVLLNHFQAEFIERVVQPNAFWKASTGCFLHSSVSHCLGSHDTTLTLSGVTIPEAWGRWYFNVTSTNRHIGCTLHETPPYQCQE